MSCKYLHIIAPYGVSPYPIIKFFRDCFPKEEHEFFVMTTKRWAINHTPRILAFLDLHYIPETGKSIFSKFRGPSELNRLMRHADHVLLHTQFCVRGKYFLPVFLQKKQVKKMIWIEYGTDLAQWKYPEKKLRFRLRNFVMERFLKKIPYIGLTLPGDEDLYLKYVGSDAKCFYTPIPVLKVYQEDMEHYRPESGDYKVPLILVGGDSRPENHHKDYFEKLSIFKDEKIAVTAFLNFGLYGENGRYGRPAYRNYVYKQGKNFFGSKYFTLAVPNVHRDRYFSTLNKIDIAIFGGERPTNPNLMFLLLLSGKKVFLPAGGGLYQFLLENDVAVFDVNAIPMVYDELFSPIEKCDNFEKLKMFFDGESAALIWKNMFDALERNALGDFE